MSREPSPKPPFIDWRLDRWKLAFLLLLFSFLLAWALLWPEDASALANRLSCRESSFHWC
jgi:hypothetical protein